MDAQTSPHPTDQTLSGLGSGKLDEGAAVAVHAHLEGCARCRERVAAISGVGVPAETRVPDWVTSIRAYPPATASYHGPGPSARPGAGAPDPGLADHPDYELKRELGRGGMGVVYLARNRLMGRDEVLKVMGRHIVDDPDLFERFLREIRAVARLRHENIVTAYSAVRLGESLVFAMEHVEGLDLSRMVKAKGPLPVALASHFAYQAALGLQHAHEEGLVHRDIKPGNLMLTRKGKKATVKVLDFGLAKVAREGSVDGSLTQEGQALGTPDFIAPEQITDAQAVDIRADIYSLGATLYYLLTGRPPFKAGSIYVVFQAHISREPDPLDQIRPEVPPELAAVVARMMAKDPDLRFQTPWEAAQALKPFFRGGNAAFRRPDVAFSASGGLNGPRPLRAPAAGATPEDHAESPAARAGTPTRPEVRWDSLIDFREADEPEEPAPAPSGSIRPPRWFWPAVAAGVLAAGLLAVLLAIGLRVRTDKGELVFDGLPDDAVVAVDGEEVEVEWPGGGGPAKVSVAAGEHSVNVEYRGVEVAGDEVKISAGDRKWIRVRLVPDVADRPEKQPVPAESPKSPEVAATPTAPPDGSPPGLAEAPAPPPATSPPAATGASDVLFADTLDDPASGWPQEDPNAPRREGDSYHYGYANGVWFNSGSGSAQWSQSIPYSAQSEFQLKVVGRVLDETPESRGRWMIHVLPKDPSHRGLQVTIERNGVIALDPSFWNEDPRPDDPRVGPIVARDFRTGTAFNTIELRVRKRQVEVLCNGAPIGPPVSYDADLIPCWIHAGVDGYKGSYRAEFDQVEVRKLAGEPAGPVAGAEAASPAARTPNLLFSDTFDDARTGWNGEDSREPGDPAHGHGYRDGVFYLSKSTPGGLSLPCARDFGGDFQVDVSGRVLDAIPDSPGFWAIHLLPRGPGLRGLQVGIDRSGLLILEPSFWTADDAANDPRLGPISLRNFKRGNKFNTMTLRVRKRQVEILVNGLRVGPTLTYGWDLTPASLHLGLNVGAGNSRAEFDRIEVRELPSPPAADPKGK